MKDSSYISSTVEALVLASPEPLSAKKIAQVVRDLKPSQVSKTIENLNNRYTESGSSFRIRELAGGYQFYILPDFAGYVDELFTRRRKLRLTRAALETAAIIAYKQPVTKYEIELIRGVSSDGVINNLLEKKMVSISGRAETPGKPLQYSTDDEFLKFFGLGTIDDLPKMAEIEELLASRASKDQTELQLPSDKESYSAKLNIADGTFDLSSREEEESEKDSEDSANVGSRLTLTRGSEGEESEDNTTTSTKTARFDEAVLDNESAEDDETDLSHEHQAEGSPTDSNK